MTMVRSPSPSSRAARREGWRLTAPNELEWFEDTVAAPRSGEVVIRVAGCGLCHTDVGYFAEGIRPRQPLPLVLGHEISGFVVAAGCQSEHWVGRAVVVPAVTPCGHCADCDSGQGAICTKQFMPGNDGDGGFASYATVPARGLCEVPNCQSPDQPLGRSGVTLRHLAVLADAVSTAWQAIQHAKLAPGGVAVIIGAGGVGGYALQLAKAIGAHTVAVDISATRRNTALGADLTFDPATPGVRNQIRAAATERGWPQTRWRIFECSGKPEGQCTAFDLLNPGATLIVVGFTRAPISVRLANLMAFDATARGTWGCLPEHYPQLVQMALDGSIDLRTNTELRPLSDLPTTLAALHQGTLAARVVLFPENG